jgi:hypothetical protein
LPVTVLYATAHYLRKGKSLRLPDPAVYSLLGIAMLFTVTRNLIS